MTKNILSIHILNSINGLAGAFFGIFVPIYLLEKTGSIAHVFYYYIVYSVVVLFSFLLASYSSNHFGLRKTLQISYVFLLSHLALLYFLDRWNISIYILACVSAVGTAFYFFPIHYLFARDSSAEEMGKEMSKFFAIPQVVCLFGPFIGGVVARLFGFSSLFVLAFVVLLFAFIPLLTVSNIKTKIHFHYSVFLKLFKKYPKYFWAEFFENMAEEIEGIFWPIFVFLTIKDVVSIGVIGTSAGLGAIAFTFLVGKYSDRFNKKLMVKIGAVLLSCLWASRLFFTDSFFVFASSVAAGFLGVFFAVPFNSIIYGTAKDNNIDEFIIFREVPIVLGRITIYCLGILLASSIKLSFIISIAVYLYLLLL